MVQKNNNKYLFKLKKSLLLIAMAFLFWMCTANTSKEMKANPDNSNSKPRYQYIDTDWLQSIPNPWTLSETQFDTILPQFQQHYPDFQNRLYAFAKWRIGTPYEIFKLGEGTGVDTDPIIRYDVSDCTGHILTSLAAVESISWNDARNRMIDLHYKPDSTGNAVPDYKHRWHYTTDRLLHNASTRNITSNLIKPSFLDTVIISLNQKDDKTQFLDLDWTSPVEVMYIPNDQINEALLQKLPQICGVAFVKKSYFKMGIIIGHEGMILDGQNLLHASQLAKETVMVNFLDYYFPFDAKPRFDGIMISEFHPIGG
jgi:hypothetical protein